MTTCSGPFYLDMLPLWQVMSFVFGACIGSFLNVCIWRIPRGESIVSVPSHCPKCGHDIRWHENIPLLSWLVLRGKCAKCRGGVSPRYFLVELLTGILFYLLFLKVVSSRQPPPVLIVYYGMTMLVVATVFIDFAHGIIPDKTTYPAMLLGVVTAVAFPEIWSTASRIEAFLFSVAGLSVSAAALTLIAYAGKLIFKAEALGWGDVKYLAAVGACLGLRATFFSVLAGSLLGSLAGIALMLIRKKGLRMSIAFGPYLALGTYVWMLYGERLTRLYFNLFR